MYKLLSGAKSVKQYRGDENLPEAGKGMKNCGCKHSRSKYKYASGTKSAYIPFTKMQPSQQNEYRKGMQEDADFNVTNIGKYAKPTKAEKELSARMDAKYKAAAKSRNTTKPVVKSKNTTQVQQAPASQTLVPVQTKPAAPVVNPVVTKPQEDSWTEQQWQDFLKEKNSVPYVKPTPYIPVAKEKSKTPVVIPPKQKIAGKYLDPKSVGVLMSQQGPTTSPKVTLKDFIYNFPKDKTRKVTQTPIKNKVEEPSIIDSAKTYIKDSIKENIPDGDVKETILNNPVSSWPSIAASAIRRKLAKSNPEDERTATIKVPDIKSSEQKSNTIQRPDVYITGDTLADKGLDRRYHVPEIIDLDSPNITYGTRSRGEYNEIKTEGAPITSAYPFVSSKKYFATSKDPSNIDYIGINSKGKIKIGKRNDFQDDDYQVSKTYVQNVESFEGLKQAQGNKNYLSPEVNIVTDSGVKMKTNLNFLVPKGDSEKAENTFDEVSGGRYIFETPDKKKRILVSGSLKTIKETFNKMKKDNPYLRVISLDNGSYAKGLRTFDQTLTPEDLKTYDAQNPVGGGNIAYIKSRVKKYKYGTGALTIPEGSAIVTANGGKNKQAIAAYKKGNYKLLNKIIDDMPEDKVSKKQAGAESLETKYKRLGELTGPLSESQQKEFDDAKSQLSKDTYDLYTDERIAEKFGQQYDVDKAKWKSSLKGGKLTLKENTENANYRNRLRTDPKYFQEQLKAGNVQIDKDGNVTYTALGEFKKGKPEFLGTYKKGTLPTLQGSEDLKTGPPASVPDDKNLNNKRKGFDIPSLAEVAARSSILGQGIEGVPENYLKLGRYKYESQLPKTLQEIQLAEQAGRETSRDIVAGDAGRYLAQAGNLSAARMKAANDAVIQDTLARQDILNKNVDLGNTEAQVNTGLKNQFAMQRAANRGAYNNQLIALGQSIDTATDASKLMSSQKSNDAQRLEMLKSMADSGNYDVVTNPDGTITYKAKQLPTSTPVKSNARGSKKLKTYKRK